MLVEEASPIRPIRSEADYEAALEEIGTLWGSPAGSPEGDRLDVLMDLVETYEERHHTIEPPDPIDAILVRMEDKGLTREGLGRILGAHSGRVSEILGRKRGLTLSMIRALASELGLSYACLCRPYELRK